MDILVNPHVLDDDLRAQLTRIAVAGTAHTRLPPELPDDVFRGPTGDPPSPDGTSSAAPVSPEIRLLRLAGIVALGALAGRQTERVDLPEPAPVDPLAPCSLEAARRLLPILQEEHSDLIAEVVDVLVARGRRLHPLTLPLALGHPRAEVRARLGPVLGAQGRWLAAKNPAWSWAVAGPSEPERDWEEGGLEARLLALRRCRAAEPGRGRAWVEAVWEQERPEVRFSLLEAMERGLCLEDEPFLERALDDRSGGVRHQAAELLGRLPGSALSARMLERAEGMVERAPSPPSGVLARLRRAAPPPLRLRVVVPTRFDPAWARDGVVARLPGGGGERAWWAAQILGQVPPDHWCRRFGLDRLGLIAALPPEPVMLEGLTRASRLPGAEGWCGPLWWAWGGLGAAEPARRHLSGERQDELAPRLVLADAERIVLAALTGGSPEPSPERAQRVLLSLPRPWSLAVSQAWVWWLTDTVARRRFARALPWMGTVMLAGRALHPDVLGQVPRVTTSGTEDWHAAQWSREVERLGELVRLRAEVLAALG